MACEDGLRFTRWGFMINPKPQIARATAAAPQRTLSATFRGMSNWLKLREVCTALRFFGCSQRVLSSCISACCSVMSIGIGQCWPLPNYATELNSIDTASCSNIGGRHVSAWWGFMQSVCTIRERLFRHVDAPLPRTTCQLGFGLQPLMAPQESPAAGVGTFDVQSHLAWQPSLQTQSSLKSEDPKGYVPSCAFTPHRTPGRVGASPAKPSRIWCPGRQA